MSCTQQSLGHSAVACMGLQHKCSSLRLPQRGCRAISTAPGRTTSVMFGLPLKELKQDGQPTPPLFAGEFFLRASNEERSWSGSPMYSTETGQLAVRSNPPPCALESSLRDVETFAVPFDCLVGGLSLHNISLQSGAGLSGFHVHIFCCALEAPPDIAADVLHPGAESEAGPDTGSGLRGTGSPGGAPTAGRGPQPVAAGHVERQG